MPIGGNMATLKEAVENALMDLIDEGKLVVKGRNGETMEDMSVEIKAVEDDDYDSDIYDSDDSEDEDDGDDKE